MDGSLRAENDIRLRINLLEGQSRTIAEMLSKAILDHNEAAFNEYVERLAVNRDRVEEILWVLGEPAGQNVLELQLKGKTSILSVKRAIEQLKAGELKMDDLSPDAQAMVRKGALQMKNVHKG